MVYTEKAYAKLNLTLDILGRRDDGYHEMKMVMQSIDLHDCVSLTPAEGSATAFSCSAAYLPTDDGNIAVKASRRFFEVTSLPPQGFSMILEKNIPVCAGMAGGSSDGAAVLRLLRRIYAPELSREALESIAASVGSDVPFCVRGGTALATGRGEILTDLPPLPDCFFVVCKPPFPISTPELFSQVRLRKLRCHPDTAGMLRALEQGDLDGIAHRVYNVFETVLPRKYAQIFEIKSRLLDLGAMTASMTGSGPTVFGIFPGEEQAKEAAAELKKDFAATFVCKNTGRSV